VDCRRWRHPPGPLCPACGSARSAWERASGRARLISWVIAHPPVLPVWKDRVPYAVVLVECEEGVRTIGGLVHASPDALRMDMPLEVDFAPSPDGDLVPQWRPA
ncbi:MAG TPA: OB-fold domain-containing protein, partial [Candidatus Polarisedimenticolia bacterium]|nr:OB-fold domain-containing protein [Candidatus Polarisedimenticolia bacterium]